MFSPQPSESCAHCSDRKRAIEVLLARTAQQDAEENAVLERAAVVEEARRKEAAARKAAAQPARPGGRSCPYHTSRGTLLSQPAQLVPSSCSAAAIPCPDLIIVDCLSGLVTISVEQP